MKITKSKKEMKVFICKPTSRNNHCWILSKYVPFQTNTHLLQKQNQTVISFYKRSIHFDPMVWLVDIYTREKKKTGMEK